MTLKGTKTVRAAKKSFRPQFDLLETRNTPASISVSGSTMIVTGDNSGSGRHDTVRIVDNGDGDLTASIDNLSVTATNITKIVMKTKGGNDDVSYRQTGNRTRSMRLECELGDGNDDFTGTIRGAVNINRTLDLLVKGQDGNDDLLVEASNDVDIRSGATMKVEMLGGDDGDKIDLNYRGEIDGTMRLRLAGEGGDESNFPSRFVRATVRADSGSGGQLRGLGSSGPATVEGNSGDDSLGFFVFKDNPNDLFAASAEVDGGNSFLFFGGNDTASHTANVNSVRVETDFVV